MKLSLVIPCYNESKNIELLLNRCRSLGSRKDWEIILVNNGSTDNTLEILERLLPQHPGCRVVNVKTNKGYGYGILAGLRAAKGEILAWTHADMQTDPQDVVLGLDLFEESGSEVLVKGRRYGRPIADTFFTIGMSGFETFLLRKPMWDINAQPTMFSRTFFETWRVPPNDFALDLYAYYEAKSQSIKVRRFPVEFGERAYGQSHWNVDWKSKWKFIQRTVSYSLKLRKRV